MPVTGIGRDKRVSEKVYVRCQRVCDNAQVTWEGGAESWVKGMRLYAQHRGEVKRAIARLKGLDFKDCVGVLVTGTVEGEKQEDILVMSSGKCYYTTIRLNGSNAVAKKEEPRRADRKIRAVRRLARRTRKRHYAKVVSLNEVDGMSIRMARLEDELARVLKLYTGHLEMHKAGKKKLEQLENQPRLSPEAVASIRPALEYLGKWKGSECEDAQCEDCKLSQQRYCYGHYVAMAARLKKVVSRMPLTEEQLLSEKHNVLVKLAKRLGCYKFGMRKVDVVKSVLKAWARKAAARKGARTRKSRRKG